MDRFPLFGDVAHVGHVEPLTPRPEESLAFFTAVVGLHETTRDGGSVYLRAWGDYERHSLKLTAHSTSGLGHVGLRVRNAAALQAFVPRLESHGASGKWVEDALHGPAYRCQTPDGHLVELYFERSGSSPRRIWRRHSRTSRSVTSRAASRRADWTT